MRVRFTSRLFAAAMAVAAMALAPAARAQGRVIVLGFGGPNGAAARAAAVKAFEDRYELVGVRDWQRRADQLGVRGTAPRALARVAKALGITAFIVGSVNRSGRSWTLGMVARDGATGKILSQKGRVIPSPNRAGAVAGSLALSMIPDLARATPLGPPDQARAEPPEPEPPAPEPEPPAPEPVERPAERAPDPTAGQPDRGRGRVALPDPPRPDESRANPYGWLEAGVEFNGASRDFGVPIDPNCSLTGRNTNLGIGISIYSEFGLRASFYPAGIFTRRWVSGLGLDFSFHHHLYLSVVNVRRPAEDREVEAEQYALAVGLVYRLAFGTADIGASLYPRIGFSRFSFALGDRNNDEVPPFVYDHIYLGLALHFPLATRYAVLEAGINYLGVISIGQDASVAYNAEGEIPSAHGFQAQVGVSGQIWAGIRWRLGFEVLGFYSNHTGRGHGWGASTCSTEWCRMQECLRDNGGTAPGGIKTTGTAVDVNWRFGAFISYRFGWRPEAQGRRRPAEPERREARDDRARDDRRDREARRRDDDSRRDRDDETFQGEDWW